MKTLELLDGKMDILQNVVRLRIQTLMAHERDWDTCTIDEAAWLLTIYDKITDAIHTGIGSERGDMTVEVGL